MVSAEIASKMINRTHTGSLSHGFNIYFELLIQMAFLGRFHALVHVRGDLRSKYPNIFSLRWKTQDHETSASVEGVPKHTKRKLKQRLRYEQRVMPLPILLVGQSSS